MDRLDNSGVFDLFFLHASIIDRYLTLCVLQALDGHPGGSSVVVLINSINSDRLGSRCEFSVVSCTGDA